MVRLLFLLILTCSTFLAASASAYTDVLDDYEQPAIQMLPYYMGEHNYSINEIGGLSFSEVLKAVIDEACYMTIKWDTMPYSSSCPGKLVTESYTETVWNLSYKRTIMGWDYLDQEWVVAGYATYLFRVEKRGEVENRHCPNEPYTSLWDDPDTEQVGDRCYRKPKCDEVKANEVGIFELNGEPLNENDLVYRNHSPTPKWLQDAGVLETTLYEYSQLELDQGLDISACQKIDKPQSCPQGKQGNPIMCTDGTKYQKDVVYQGKGELPLDYSTYYKSDSKVKNYLAEVPTLTAARGFSHLSSVTVDEIVDPRDLSQTVKARVLTINLGAFGKKVFYHDVATNGYSTLDEQQGSISVDAQSNFVYTDKNQTTYTFDQYGTIVSKRFANGQGYDYIYGMNGDNPIITIRNTLGQQVELLHNIDNQLEFFTDPAGQVYEFTYDASGNLSEIIYPDNTPETKADNPRKTYLYEDANFESALTAVIDENNTRFASWFYDEQGRAISSEHAMQQELVELTYVDGDTTEVKHIKTDGQSVTQNYDFKRIGTSDKITKIETVACDGCATSVTTYEYSTEGWLTKETSENGVINTYDYNDRGLRTRATYAVGTSEETTINTVWHAAFTKPTSITQGNLNQAFGYDEKGQLIISRMTDSATGVERTTRYNYTATGQVASIDGPRTDVNDITAFEYNALGQVTRVTNALGHETQVTQYDAHGNPLTIIDANSVSTTLTYNERQWLTSMTRLGLATTFAYDKVGQLTKVNNPDGTELSYSYDDAHRLIQVTNHLGESIHYVLDSNGNATQTTIKDSAQSVVAQQLAVYNAINELTQSLGNNGQSQSFNYDAEGNLVSQENALLNQSSSEYDALNRLRKSIDPLQGETAFNYDALGNLAAITDAEAKTTQYQYNAFGEVTSVTSPDTGITQYSYDEAGNRTQVINHLNQVTNYSYDALNRVTAIQYTDSGLNVAIDYDGTPALNPNAIGRVTKVTDASGITEFAYNTMGALTHETKTLSGKVFVTEYRYNSYGQLVSVVYPSGRSIDYTLNVLGQITAIDSTVDGTTQSILSNATYLPFGPVNGFNYGNGLTQSYQYDQDYRLTNAQLGSLLDKSCQYSLVDEITTITDTATVTNQDFSYDALSRLTDASDNQDTLSYSYDAIGNRLSKTANAQTDTYSYVTNSHHISQVVGNQTVNFTVNALGQTTAKNNQAFTYNMAGRIANLTDSATSADYHYNYAQQRVQKTVNGETTIYHYDMAGQLIAESDAQGAFTKEYVWFSGQLVAVIETQQSAGEVMQEQDVIYNDDAPEMTKTTGWRTRNASSGYLGQHKLGAGYGGRELTWTPNLLGGRYQVYAWWVQSSKKSTQAPYTISHNGQTNVVYVNQTQSGGQWNLLGEFEFSGDGSEWVKIDDSNGQVSADAVRFVRVIDAPVEQVTMSTYFAHNNHLATPILLTDQGQNKVWSTSYTPFGLGTPQDDVDGDGNRVTLNIRFPGQYYDAESGLHYNWHRYYDPELGRYITSDPLGLYDGPSTYGYAHQNPVNKFDPNGQSALSIAWNAAKASPAGRAAVYGYRTGQTIAQVINATRALPHSPSVAELEWFDQIQKKDSKHEWIEDENAQVEYDYYKAVCDVKMPTTGDECEDLRRISEQASLCAELRQQWDDKWMPGRHAIEIANQQRKAIKYKKLAEECEKNRDNQCEE